MESATHDQVESPAHTRSLGILVEEQSRQRPGKTEAGRGSITDAPAQAHRLRPGLVSVVQPCQRSGNHKCRHQRKILHYIARRYAHQIRRLCALPSIFSRFRLPHNDRHPPGNPFFHKYPAPHGRQNSSSACQILRTIALARSSRIRRVSSQMVPAARAKNRLHVRPSK